MKTDQGYWRGITSPIKRGLVLAGVALTIAAPATAQSGTGGFELGFDVGRAYVGGQIGDGTESVGQLRAGLFLTERFELEGQWSRVDTDGDVDLDRLLLNAVFNFRLRDRGQSYFLAGVGRADVDFEDSLPGGREDHSSTVQIAAGRRFFLGADLRLAARFEVSLWREQVFDSGSTVNAGMTGGLTWRTGVSPEARQGLVGGRAWIDEDGDGLDAEGREPPVPGVTVSISRDGEEAAPPALSDEQGRYAFALLEPGAYRLDFAVPAGFRIAPGGSPRVVEVVAGGQAEAGLGVLRRESIGFSADHRAGAVTGRVWVDRNEDGTYGPGEGLAGIAVRLTREGEAAGREAVAGESGEFSFDRCPPGTYQVALVDMEALRDYRLPPGISPQRVEVPAPVGLSATPLRDTVTGRVWVDADADTEDDAGEPGVAGARLRLSRRHQSTGDEAAAGPDGRFQFEGLAAGPYELTLLDSAEVRGITILPGTSPITLDVRSRIGLVVDVVRDAIIGRVGIDRDADGRLSATEPGLGRLTVRLSREGRLPSDVRSRDDGTFDWADRRPGTYQVEALEWSLPSGHWIPQGGLRRTIEVFPPVGLLAEGLEERIEGRVWVDGNKNQQLDPGEPGFAGAEVTVSQEELEVRRGGTGPDGNLGFTELAAGTYDVAAVAESLRGMWPDPATSPRRVEVLPALDGSIGGSAWVDRNADGRFDDDERPLSGLEIGLRRDDQPVDSVEIGPRGDYSFVDLEPGAYQVWMSFQPGEDLGPLASPLAQAAEVRPGTRTDADFALALIELPPAPWLWWLLLIVGSLGALVWLVHRWWKYGKMLAPCFRRWRIFRRRERADLRREIDAARRHGLQNLERVSKKLGKVCCADWDIATEYFLAHRGHQGWSQMYALAAAMSPHLARKVKLRQQKAFALNRDGLGEQAEEILKELRPSAETCGLLGRVYKDRWDAARRSGAAAGSAELLDQAIQAYRKGHETEPSNPYPGINLLTLMEFTAAPAGERAAVMETVRGAARKNTRSSAADYWAWATLLELAVHELDEGEARQALAQAVGATDERWQYETTLRNIKLIRAAREARGEASPAWVAAVEMALENAFNAGAA